MSSEILFLDSQIKMPLMNLPVRSVVIHWTQSDGTKRGILFSPGSKIDRNIYHDLKNRGIEITDIVANNLFHLGGVPKAKSIFPTATTWGPLGAKEKRSDIQWDKTLDQDPWPYENEVSLHPLRGQKVNESVFIHRNTKALIVADLCFNMTKISGLGPWIILNLFGTYRKFGVSKFFIRFVQDHAKFAESLNQLFSSDFDQIIVSHGENVLTDGKTILRQALAKRGIHLKF